MNSDNNYNDDYSSLNDIFSGSQLKLLDQIGKTINFKLEADKNAKESDVGFSTNMKTRVINYNPHTIDKLEDFRKFAFFGHELGHHFREVVEFQNECEKLIPICIEKYLDNFLGKPRATKLLYSVINILADVVLESCIPKYGEVITSKLLENSFIQNRGITFIESLESKDELLKKFDDNDRKVFPRESYPLGNTYLFKEYMDLYLLSPFFNLPDEGLVRDEISERYNNIIKISSLLKNPSITPEEKSKSILFFVKDIAELLEIDKENLTDNDIDKDIENLNNDTEGGSGDNSDLKAEKLNKDIDKILGAIEQITGEVPKGIIENIEDGNKSVLNDGKVEDLIDDILKSSEKGLNDAIDFGDEMNAKKAKLLGIRPETYGKYLNTLKEYNSEIKGFREVLAKFVLQDYKNITFKNKRQGFMPTPGKESETYIRSISGERNPNTFLKRNKVEAPKTLQLYFLIDTSYSMINDIDDTLGFYTIFSKAVLEIQEEITKNKSKYHLPKGVKSPVQIEVVGFNDNPILVLDINEKITQKKLAQGYEYILDATSDGGGTNDYKALKYEHSRMKLQNSKVIKIMSMITDGGGYGDIIEPILDQIERDKSIYFLANGIGKEGLLVKEYYQKKFKPSSAFHVFADESKNSKEASGKTIGFFKQVIKKQFKK